jgi:hypothetical protein
MSPSPKPIHQNVSQPKPVIHNNIVKETVKSYQSTKDVNLNVGFILKSY